MSMFPLEILRLICEHAAELVAPRLARDRRSPFEADASTTVHYLALSGLSRASRICREVSVPYLFRSVTVRTAERASSIVTNPLFHHVRHIHLPAVDVLTSRRPIPSPVLKLVSQATSMRITATNPSFFLTARTLVSRLLNSARALDVLEFYCEPISQQLDSLTILANLIPACPKTLKALYFAMPGGQPEASGVETLLNALSSINQEVDPNLLGLETIGISVHLAPLLAPRPEHLALAISHRLPALRRVTFVAPGKNPRREIPVLELVGPKDRSRAHDFKTGAITWEFQRSMDGMCAEIGGKDMLHLEALHLNTIEFVH